MAVTLTSKSKRRNKRIEADEELIADSLKRFKLTAEAEEESRRQALEDLRFSIGTGQWDEAVKANREIEGKPCLTINRAPAFLRQYTGEERQHRPAMIVSPVGSGADLEAAKIHQGVLRHTEVVSFADVTYDNSYDMMMRIGWCPWRIKTDYVSEMSFDQEPRIEAIENPFAVFMSPVRRPDGTDPLWAHIVRDYSKDDYKAEFGDTDLAKLQFPTQAGNAEPSWVTKDGVRVAEYWWIELTAKIVCQLDDGRAVLKDELADEDKDRIVGERETVIRNVNCVKHDAMRVLKRYQYLGKYIPLVEVNGVRLNVNGKIYRAGMVRDYRDAQRIYDFMVTRAVEHVDQVSKDPLLVAMGSGAEGNFAEFYRQMNRKNYPYLPYMAYDEQGRGLPPPQRANRQSSIDQMAKLVQQADYDMKAVIGIYGPTLGEESGSAQESGFAILSRQQQSDTGMVAWHDQLNRAIVWQGKILLDIWPKLISSARVQRIVNPDDSVRHAVIFNSQHSDPEEAQAMLDQAQGLQKAYDVGVGDYDITLSTGPMYRTARQEAFKAITQVIATEPQLMLPILGDIWAKNADFPDADVIEKRLKKLLPPNLQEADSQDKDSQIAQKDAQLQALGAQHNQLVAELNRASDTIRTKRLELESRERIALWQNLTALMLQRMKSSDAAAQSHMDAQIHAIQMRLIQLHELEPIEQEAGPPGNSPELPTQVEPKVQPITPAAPTPRVQPIPQGSLQ